MPKLAELRTVADNIDAAVSAAVERWKMIPEAVLIYRSSDNAWSIKEVIGHLIDSAANNHQRFVRLQLVKELMFPDYSTDNENWVNIQSYQDRPWEDLLGLWRHFNGHLAHLMRCVDPACLEHVWVMNTETRVTLFELMDDYLRHLKEHVKQIENILD